MLKRKTQLRIISGEYGGRLIDTPGTDVTRPMGDRERMAIFNRLRDELPGAVVLDAFAGSGAIGIEALSLGAKSVDFMEKNPQAIRTIKNNLAKLGLTEQGKITKRPAATYDLIFADPPYDNPQYALVESLVDSLRLGGFFVLSHPANLEPPKFASLSLLSDKKYAAACIKIFQKH